jgi:thymidylate kinase
MMQLTSTLEQTDRPMPLGKDEESGPGRILLRVFESLDRAGIRYCVLHGYEGFPQRTGSDVDCIIDSEIPPEQIYALLHHDRARINADIVRCRGYYVVLAGKNTDSSPCFLTLDLSADCELDGVPFYAGTEVLASRRRYREFWIPAAHLEFGCYLVRTIAKACLDDERARKLSWLYRQDAACCQREVARFWRPRNVDLIVAAARSDDWHCVRQHLASLRQELRRRAILRRPGRFVGNKFRRLIDRAKRVWRPDGLNVVFLGPDGAGKSTVIDGLGPRLHGAFARTTCSGFAPPLHRLFRRGNRPTDQPHALASRSFLTSLVRAAYWFVYYTFDYVGLHLALARSTLVLNDRHFVDILVDRKRYRYGGPLWLLHLIWRVVPKPNLIILLDAPPHVLQARKQEVSFQETALQREAYLLLAGTLPNCHVVDASQSSDRVAGEVSKVILRHLTMRLSRRFALEQVRFQ